MCCRDASLTLRVMMRISNSGHQEPSLSLELRSFLTSHGAATERVPCVVREYRRLQLASDFLKDQRTEHEQDERQHKQPRGDDAQY